MCSTAADFAPCPHTLSMVLAVSPRRHGDASGIADAYYDLSARGYRFVLRLIIRVSKVSS